jgi:hypothetical protein
VYSLAGTISPIFAELSGLSPLVIQALDRAGQLLSAHLAGAQHVTA